MVSKILKKKQDPEVKHLWTLFRNFYTDKNIPLSSKKKRHRRFLTNNSNYPRGILMKILDVVEPYSNH